MRLPWQPKEPPLALRIARTLERRGVGIAGLAVETHGGRATLRGVVTSDLAHTARSKSRARWTGESIDDLLSFIDPQTFRPRRAVATRIARPSMSRGRRNVTDICGARAGRSDSMARDPGLNRGVVGSGALAPAADKIPKSDK